MQICYLTQEQILFNNFCLWNVFIMKQIFDSWMLIILYFMLAQFKIGLILKQHDLIVYHLQHFLKIEQTKNAKVKELFYFNY